MRRHFVALTFVALPLATALTVSQVRIAARQPLPPGPASGLQLDAIDRSADACTDFYQFACGGWVAKNPVPPDRASWSRLEELQERNNETLRRILDAAAAGRDPASKKIGDYYASCMDEPAINAKGAAPLEPLLKKIDKLASVNDLSPLVAELHTLGVNVFFSFGAESDYKDAAMVMAIADQGGLGLPDRDYYVRDDAKSVELRTQYVAHVAKMFALLSTPQAQADAAAQHVMAIERALAKSALDTTSRREPTMVYHKLTPAELQEMTGRFDWSRYFPGSAHRRCMP